MTPDATDPEPRYERYRLVYPSGTVVEAFYAGGAPLEEVRVTHLLAVVEAIEESLVGVGKASSEASSGASIEPSIGQAPLE